MKFAATPGCTAGGQMWCRHSDGDHAMSLRKVCASVHDFGAGLIAIHPDWTFLLETSPKNVLLAKTLDALEIFTSTAIPGHATDMNVHRTFASK